MSVGVVCGQQGRGHTRPGFLPVLPSPSMGPKLLGEGKRVGERRNTAPRAHLHTHKKGRRRVASREPAQARRGAGCCCVPVQLHPTSGQSSKLNETPKPHFMAPRIASFLAFFFLPQWHTYTYGKNTPYILFLLLPTYTRKRFSFPWSSLRCI